MVALRLMTIAVGAACVLAFADGAQARGPFDGSWTVSVAGRSGACAGGNYAYNVQIVNGSVRYHGGDAQISGRVSGGGGNYAYNVQIVNGSVRYHGGDAQIS